MIKSYGVNYLADKQCQTTIEMINILQDIASIKPFKQYKISIILKEFKKKLFLVKNKKKARYEVERLEQIRFFFETDSNGTV